MLRAAGSKIERWHTQMQDIKSLILFLGRCGPLHMVPWCKHYEATSYWKEATVTDIYLVT